MKQMSKSSYSYCRKWGHKFNPSTEIRTKDRGVDETRKISISQNCALARLSTFEISVFAEFHIVLCASFVGNKKVLRGNGNAGGIFE